MEFVDKIMKPFTPVKVKKDGDKIIVEVIGRTYTVDNGELFSSIVANGTELLAKPMRVTGLEDGEEIKWTKRKTFIHSHTAEKAVIISALESKMFDLNIVMTIEYDGFCDVSLRVMTTSFNMAQRLRLEPWPTWKYQLTKLWVEAPLVIENTTLYMQYPGTSFYDNDKTVIEYGYGKSSGFLPEGNFNLPFKALFWVGNEEKGLGFSADSDQYRQPSDEKHYIDSVIEDGARVIRTHLLDSNPFEWVNPRHDATYFFPPISFNFGIQATPVRPFPKSSRIHNAIQFYSNDLTSLDKPIFKDSKLSGFDEIKKLGINTVFVHETWNKIQNTPDTDEETIAQLKYATEEFHKRGIKIMPYFGYEISTLSPNFEYEFENDRIDKGDLAKQDSTWWRYPPQRDYGVCYNSDYCETLTNGIKKLVDECHFDGVYLDGTIFPRQCFNLKHGCGYVGQDGKVHGTYPLKGIRKTMKRIYEIFAPNDGLICYHSATPNFTAMAFTHMGWTGENVQVGLIHNGPDSLSLGFARTEWGGRNFGVPMEMIVYPNPPKWNFLDAVALGLVHEILPRPQYSTASLLAGTTDENFVSVSNIWKAIENYPMDKAVWHPYFDKNTKKLTDSDILFNSYYTVKMINGKEQILAYVSNLKTTEAKNVKIADDKYEVVAINLTAKENADKTFDFKPFSYAIFAITEK